MNAFLKEVKNHKRAKRQHLVDKIIAKMDAADAEGLRTALLDNSVGLNAIHAALLNRGHQISKCHLSVYRTEMINGLR